MPIVTELFVTVAGGVLTAVILAMFARSGKSKASVGAVGAAPARRQRGSFFGDLFRLVLAVICGIAIAIVGGRLLIEAGIVPRGLPSRLGLLVGGTVICWLFLSAARR